MRRSRPLVKLIDESGANIWWKQFRNYEFPVDWTTIRIRRNDIRFAWGPIEDHNLKTVASMEFVIVGATGDRGTVEFDTLGIRTLPELPAVVAGELSLIPVWVCAPLRVGLTLVFSLQAARCGNECLCAHRESLKAGHQHFNASEASRKPKPTTRCRRAF